MTKKKSANHKGEQQHQPEQDDWGVARFESWLRVGLESYVLEGADAEAFPGAIRFILECRSLTLGLRTFAEHLNAARRDAFKHAIANVLSAMEPRERYAPVVEHLLSIAIATSAYPILNVLPGKIGNGFFGQADEEDRRSLFTTTLLAVTRLATPGREDAKRCLRALIASDNFRPAHAATALIGLCLVDSGNLAEHLRTAKLRPMLLKQFDQYDEDGSVQKQLAEQILEIIGPEELQRALPELDMLDPDSPIGGRPDDWFVEALFFQPGAPFEITIPIKAPEVSIVSRDNPDVSILLPMTPRQPFGKKAIRQEVKNPIINPDHGLSNMPTPELCYQIKSDRQRIFGPINSGTAHACR